MAPTTHRDTLVTRLLTFEAERVADDLGTDVHDPRVCAQLTTVESSYWGLPTAQLEALEQGYLARRAAARTGNPTATPNPFGPCSPSTPQTRQDYLRKTNSLLD